jgi:hypothetical protein
MPSELTRPTRRACAKAGLQGIPLSTPADLTAEQEQFLARACAFLATNPPQDELNKLLTLAAMLLPAPVAEMLARRAATACSPRPDERPARRLQ